MNKKKTIACDRCGARLDHIPKICPECGEIIYDRMDPHIRERITEIFNKQIISSRNIFRFFIVIYFLFSFAISFSIELWNTNCINYPDISIIMGIGGLPDNVVLRIIVQPFLFVIPIIFIMIHFIVRKLELSEVLRRILYFEFAAALGAFTAWIFSGSELASVFAGISLPAVMILPVGAVIFVYIKWKRKMKINESRYFDDIFNDFTRQVEQNIEK